MLVATALVVLVGMAAMLAIAGRIAEDRLNDRVEEVNKDFDASLNRFREDVRRELDTRAPQGTGGVGAPTPTPFPTPTPEPTATPEGDGAATPTPTSSPDESVPDPELTPDGELRP